MVSLLLSDIPGTSNCISDNIGLLNSISEDEDSAEHNEAEWDKYSEHLNECLDTVAPDTVLDDSALEFEDQLDIPTSNTQDIESEVEEIIGKSMTIIFKSN